MKSTASSSGIKSEADAKTNHGKEYDKYYGGAQSIYEKLYGGNVISRDKWVIEQAIFKNIVSVLPDSHGERTLRIADYGCGDGRYLQIIAPIARVLKERGVRVELVGYDPSKTGLEKFEGKLAAGGFSKIASEAYRPIAEEEGGEKGYHANEWTGNSGSNLTVRLIHGHVHDALDHIAALIGPVHLTLCMFGVLSHVPQRQNRIDLLTMLGNITSEGAVIVTLPGHRILAEQNKLFSAFRKHQFTGIGEASEEGDVYYTRVGEDGKKQVQNFYHIYQSAREVEIDLMAARLVPSGGVQIQKILHETTLTHSKTLAKIDEWVSWGMPSFVKDYAVGYYLAVAERPKELRKHPQPSSFVEKLAMSRESKDASTQAGY